MEERARTQKGRETRRGAGTGKKTVGKKTRGGTAKAPLLSTHGAVGINAPVRVHRPGECSRASRMHLRMQCLAPVSSSSTPFPWRGSTLPSVLPLALSPSLLLRLSPSYPGSRRFRLRRVTLSLSLSVLPGFSPFSATMYTALPYSLLTFPARPRALSLPFFPPPLLPRSPRLSYPTALSSSPIPFRTFTLAEAKPYTLHPKNNPHRGVSYDLYTAYVK